MDIMIPKESFPEIEYENEVLFPRYNSVVTLRQDNKSPILSPVSIEHNRSPLTCCHVRSDREKHLNDTKHKQSQHNRSHQRLPSPRNGVLNELNHSSNPEGPNLFKFQQLCSTAAIHSCTSGGSNATLVSA